MKFKSWTAGIAVLTLAAAPAFAEDSLAQWSYDQQVSPVGCCDSGYGCGDGCDCGSGCGGGRGGLLSGFGPGYVEGFSLANAFGVGSQYEVGGWTQFGSTSEPTLLSSLNDVDGDPTTNARDNGGSFNNIEDRLNLHQQYFYFGRKANGANGLDYGYRADFIYGIDGPDTQSFGNPDGSFDYDNGDDTDGAASDFTRGDGSYGWAIPQLYGELAMGDLSVKIGHFYTLVGYESVMAPQNFFYSHSLSQYNSEPFTHTGVLGTYTGYENLTLYGGWTLGWDTGFDNFNSGSNLISGFSAGLSDNVTFTYINTYGNFGKRGGDGQDDSYSHSIVMDVALTNALQYVFQTDMVAIDRDIPPTVGNDQFSINQYLFYKYNDIVTLGSRIEWWKSDGLSYYEYTTGANIQLLDNLILRPEYRQDWVPGLDNFDEEIAAMDMILTY